MLLGSLLAKTYLGKVKNCFSKIRDLSGWGEGFVKHSEQKGNGAELI